MSPRVALLVSALTACGGGGLDLAALAKLAELSPTELPAPPTDRSNRFAADPAAARLGQRFFFDPRFSGRLLDGDNDGGATALGKVGQTGRVSCAGCHIPTSGFVDTRSNDQQISLAAGWGLRKAPSLLDVAQGKLFTWGGRSDTLHNQVFQPLELAVEMNSSRLFVAQQLARLYRADYEAVFGPLPAFDDPALFPQLTASSQGCQPKYGQPKPGPCDGRFHGMPGDGAEFDSLTTAAQRDVDRAVINLGKAISAYERQLTCGQGRFDRWVHGEKAALNASEQRGAALFVGKANCVSCHSGPYFSDQGFHNVGLGPRTVGAVFADLDDHGAIVGIAGAIADPLNVRGPYSDGDDGRLPTVVTPEMDGAFKTPMLRCVGLRPSFMHTAQIRTLAQVVEFFDRGGDGPGLFGKNEIGPLGLTAQDKQDLVGFLQALNGAGPDPRLLRAP